MLSYQALLQLLVVHIHMLAVRFHKFHKSPLQTLRTLNKIHVL